MYCKKCNRLIKNSSEKCPYCDFDNTVEINIISNELKEKKIPKKDTNINKRAILIISFLIIISISLVVTYTIKDLKNDKQSDAIFSSITTTEEKRKKLFKYKNLTMEYPENFGASSNTIFYKDNSSINIEINLITIEEYNNLIELNEHLDSKIGDFSSTTYAEDNSYSNLINIDNNYYHIKVNYVNDPSIYNEEIQLTISNILSTLKKK